MSGGAAAAGWIVGFVDEWIGAGGADWIVGFVDNWIIAGCTGDRIGAGGGGGSADGCRVCDVDCTGSVFSLRPSPSIFDNIFFIFIRQF